MIAVMKRLVTSKMAEKDVQAKKKPIKIIILLVVLLVVAVSSFVAYKFIFSKKSEGEVAPKNVKEVTYSLGEFTQNLADEDMTRYIKTTIYVGHDESSEIQAELEGNIVAIRDSVIAVLMSKTAEELDVFGVEQLKRELIIRINAHLKKGKIKDVYFYDLLIQ